MKKPGYYFTLILIVSTIVGLAGCSGNSTINGHEYVDLGLSVKWATCNVGAHSPSDYGDYYAWGETKPKKNYTQENSETVGKDLEDIAGNSSYDVARDSWGGTWRLPTEADMRELVDKCEWEWTTQEGYNGYRVTGPNGNSIFLPAAGYRAGAGRSGNGSHGFYWGSTPVEGSTNDACTMGLSSDDHSVGCSNCHYGQSVRPVSE